MLRLLYATTHLSQRYFFLIELWLSWYLFNFPKRYLKIYLGWEKVTKKVKKVDKSNDFHDLFIK